MTRTILARQVWIMYRKRPLVTCNEQNIKEEILSAPFLNSQERVSC